MAQANTSPHTRRADFDSADVIARDYPMPPLEVGDIVVSPMMGAYTAVTSSRFNGIPATRIVMVQQVTVVFDNATSRVPIAEHCPVAGNWTESEDTVIKTNFREGYPCPASIGRRSPCALSWLLSGW